MGISERPEHLFVVRLWQEPSLVTPPGQWRGSAEHVPSGQRGYFITLEELNQFILAQLQIAALASPKPS
jgi:hypothetical protein